jgi:hypothetical protein
MFKILLFISSFVAFVVGSLVVLIGIGAITGIAGGLIVMCSGGVITFLAVCTALAILLPEPEKLFADARPAINLVKRNGRWA